MASNLTLSCDNSCSSFKAPHSPNILWDTYKSGTVIGVSLTYHLNKLFVCLQIDSQFFCSLRQFFCTKCQLSRILAETKKKNLSRNELQTFVGVDKPAKGHVCLYVCAHVCVHKCVCVVVLLREWYGQGGCDRHRLLGRDLWIQDKQSCLEACQRAHWCLEENGPIRCREGGGRGEGGGSSAFGNYFN